ncbi:MAG: cell wall-binding repeat-containing protein [Coriobacteriia bacterium]
MSLVASMAGIIPAAAAPAKAPAGIRTKPAARVTSGSLDVTGERLDADLAEAVAAATTDAAKAEKLDVAVLVAKGSKAPKGLEMPVKLALRADEAHDLFAGKAAVGSLVKVASAAGVEKVYENGTEKPPVIPDVTPPTKAERAEGMAVAQARLEDAKRAGVLKDFAAQFDDDGVLKTSTVRSSKDAAAIGEDAVTYDGGSATGWFDVSPIGHNAVGAWDDGYFGDGVRIAVADDSVDFAHPDLQGTQAVIDDPASPYVGWPEVFDPFSALLYLYDQYYGTTFVADGDTWWSDTSAVITTAAPTFGGKTYVLPQTSLSGEYHIGFLWEENLAYWSPWLGGDGYPAVLVVDENVAGVYDTVYVDVDYMYDFTLQKPCTMASPISFVDYYDSVAGTTGQDGFADLSGGMVYWIADGANQPPGFEFLIGGPDDTLTPPSSGEMVCFTGALNFDENHGTLCASNVVGQGMTDGPSDLYMDEGAYPPWKTPVGAGGGMVQGAARNGELVAFSDIYWNHFTSTLLAYDYAAFGADGMTDTGDEIQIVSNSYGESDEDADEWDYRSRYITDLNTWFNPYVSFLFSTGNGAPGYGTNAPPTASTAIGIGASTQFGACGGWDSIYDADQVNIGDVIPWSNRGPSAAGHTGPAVVADGAYSSGAMALNQGYWDGWSSWIVWGGTSRSCPVAAGNLALIYDAYNSVHGVYPQYDEARALLMNGARDLDYDTTVQGAGMIDSGRSVDIITGQSGVAVWPSVWYPGDYRGTEYESFVDLVHPGDVVTDTFTVTNFSGSSVDVTVTDSWHQLGASIEGDVELDGTLESAYDFDRPDYLWDLTSFVDAQDPDLLVITTTEDFADFAPTGAFNTDPRAHNRVRLLAYNWMDQNLDGNLWTDANVSGYVDPGEIDEGEYMRFTYANNFADSHEIRVQNPASRNIDGFFFGLQHQSDAVTDTSVTVHVRVECWNKVDNSWITDSGDFTVGANSATAFDATYSVPLDTPVGFYEGELLVSVGGTESVVPVHATVAAADANFAFGMGSMETDSIAQPGLMPNNMISGYQDWGWRAESGDWRFYMTDVADDAALPEGATWLVRTSWPVVGSPTDMQADNDTLLFGLVEDEFTFYNESVFGPGTLAKTGASSNTNTTGGIWTWQTNTGTTEEWVSAPITTGLNEIMVHNVVWPGGVHELALDGQAGVVGVAPAGFSIVDSADSGTEPLGFTTSMDLTGLAADAYGLTRNFESNEPITQDEDWLHEVTLADAAYLEVQIAAEGGSDLDLYVYESDGVGGWTLIGASETSSGEEYVRIDAPADNDYMVDVYGYSVTGTDYFDISIANPMGDDMTVSGIPAGAVAADTSVDLELDWTKARPSLLDREGTYEGVVYLGPVEAPSAITIPVTLRYPFEVEWTDPSPKSAAESPYNPIEVQFSKRVDESTLDASTFYVTDGTDVVPATIDYDPVTALATLTPTEPLVSASEYAIVVDGVWSMDGDDLSAEITFSTIDALSRSMGTDRYKTAVEISRNTFAQADTVVVATGQGFADALSASGLAGVTDAPLLLTQTASLPASVTAEIERLGATTAYVVGGTAAVSAAVQAALDAIPGVSVKRIAGTNRYDTAAKVAAEVAAIAGTGFSGEAFLARGDDFADALAVSPFAYSSGMPVLLTATGSLPDVTRAAIADLGISDVWISGGTKVVSSTVASAVDAMSGVAIHRMAGADRYATAVVVAETAAAEGWGDWNYVGIATGMDFPDAVGGGVATGAQGGMLLMTSPTALSPATMAAIEAHADGIGSVEIFGGTSAVSLTVSNAIAALVW